MDVVREFYEVIPSTQPRARELALAGAPEGSRVIAARQTDGRGRLDHRWASPPGGLYMSLLVATPRATGSLLPLAIGAEIASEVRRRWGVDVRVKWPNDLWVDRGPAGLGKLGGILLDALPPVGGRTIAVAGIGINVATPTPGYPSGMRVPPVTLQELRGAAPPVREVEDAAVAAALRGAHGLDAPEGAASALRAVRSLLFGVGRSGAVDGESHGTIRTVDDEGSLVLEIDGSLVPFRAGDLTVEAA